MGWYLSPNPTSSSEENPLSCDGCNEHCSLITEINDAINLLNIDQREKSVHKEQLDKIEESLCHYVSHLVTGKHQRLQYLSQINNCCRLHDETTLSTPV